MGKKEGFSLIELLIVLALLGCAAALAAPALDRVQHRAALVQAGYRLLADTQKCQTLAARHLARVGIVFDVDHRGRFYVLVQDGNGNGVSRKDYLAGRDKVVGGPVYLREFGRQVRLGPPFGVRVPKPDESGWVPESGVQAGHAGILSFSPGLGASPGSVYLSAGTRVVALRVTPMGVARLLTWDAGRRAWRPLTF